MFGWAEYKPYKQGLQTVLNPLESEVMQIMWREKSATARTVYTLLKARHSVNRPTVTAAMSSLCKRGLLKKTISKGRGGLRYVFKVQVSRGRFEREVVGKVIDSLLESFEGAARKEMKRRLKG